MTVAAVALGLAIGPALAAPGPPTHLAGFSAAPPGDGSDDGQGDGSDGSDGSGDSGDSGGGAPSASPAPAGATAPSTAAAAPVPGAFVPLQAARLYDSRDPARVVDQGFA